MSESNAEEEESSKAFSHIESTAGSPETSDALMLFLLQRCQCCSNKGEIAIIRIIFFL
jgi:hypothetical protein